MNVLEFPLQPGKLADVHPFVGSVVAKDRGGARPQSWNELAVARALHNEIDVSWGRNDYCVKFELLAVDSANATHLAIVKWTRLVEQGHLPDWDFVESHVRDGLFGDCFDDF